MGVSRVFHPKGEFDREAAGAGYGEGEVSPLSALYSRYFIMDGKDALSVPGPRVVIDADSNKAKNNTEGYCYIGYGFGFVMSVSVSRHCNEAELESLITATRYRILSSIYNKIPKEKHRSVEDWTRVFKE